MPETLIVGAIVPDGPADRAGLGVGDTVLGVSRLRTTSIAAFWRVAAQRGPEAAGLAVLVVRGGDVVEAYLNLASDAPPEGAAVFAPRRCATLCPRTGNPARYAECGCEVKSVRSCNGCLAR